MSLLTTIQRTALTTLMGFGSILVYGQTTISKWQDGKTGAVTITYDDGSINQFRKALPIMNRLNIPATFYIITTNSWFAIPGPFYWQACERHYPGNSNNSNK